MTAKASNGEITSAAARRKSVAAGARSAGKAPAGRRRAGRTAGRAIKQYDLRLYVAGQTAKSLAAFTNLKKICDEHLAGRYRIEVIDLMKNPQLAQGDQILAIPTLVRKLPQPIKKIIGDLSDTLRVLVGLDVRPSN